MIDRRRLVGGATLATLLGAAVTATPALPNAYGSVGRIRAKPGERDALAALILAGASDLPGCLSYVVAEDLADADALWVVETWTDKAAHDASLRLPVVRAAIAKARPLIAGFDSGAELRVLGGIGPKGR